MSENSITNWTENPKRPTELLGTDGIILKWILNKKG
jgi:hypothetical protein